MTYWDFQMARYGWAMTGPDLDFTTMLCETPNAYSVRRREDRVAP